MTPNAPSLQSPGPVPHLVRLSALARRARIGLLTCALPGVLFGCTASQYEIGRGELKRLSHLDPSERGARVQALQQTAYDQDDLSGAGMDDAPTASNTTLVLLANERHHRHRDRRQARRRAETDDGDDDAESLAGAAAVALAVASVALVPVAITEGVRHDGWVQLPEDQPLYLVGPDRWISLRDLAPEDVALAERAVTPAWSDDVEPLERRPLDRVGLAYTLELSTARLPHPEASPLLGYGGRLSLGGHPTASLGLYVGAQFAYGSAPEAAGASAFLGKVFGAAELLPVTLGIFHAGFYGEGGLSGLVQGGETPRKLSEPYVAAGPSFQLTLSTRIALGLRVGATQLLASGHAPIPELAFGVAVY